MQTMYESEISDSKDNTLSLRQVLVVFFNSDHTSYKVILMQAGHCRARAAQAPPSRFVARSGFVNRYNLEQLSVISTQ